MKGKLHEHKAGMIVGAFAGLWHAAWALLVATGLAQGLLDWIYELHFLDNPFMVAAFNLTTAVTLVAVTAVMGYVVGWVLATLWNMMGKK